MPEPARIQPDWGELRAARDEPQRARPEPVEGPALSLSKGLVTYKVGRSRSSLTSAANRPPDSGRDSQCFLAHLLTIGGCLPCGSLKG